MADRPAFDHRPERHGVVGPFSGRQLVAAFASIVVAVVVLVAITTPLNGGGDGPGTVDPRATSYLIGSAPPEGLRIGATAPEFTVPLGDGSTYQLADLHGNPIRLADLRGKAVWINFWTTWCPPCQSEVPILRDVSARYRDRGLELIAISVQETSPADVQAYADRYQLGYTIGFRRVGHDLPRVQGVRAADPGVHRPERGDPVDRRRAARRGRRDRPGRGHPAGCRPGNAGVSGRQRRTVTGGYSGS